jgi:hypothetical protein
MDKLPLDLLRPTIEHLHDDLESLLAVSLASRELRAEGQRILFKTMALMQDKEAHIKFLTVIISSSLLAQHVKEFYQFELLDPERQEEPLWDLTCRGLNAMINLKRLFFGASKGGPSATILRGCTFQLETLRWENYHDAEQLLEFISSQPNLRCLGFEWIGPELNTSGICPGLQTLHGDRRTIDAFLSGRSITSLKWCPHEEELRRDAPIYTPPQEFHHLRYLSFGGYLGRPSLSAVTEDLPALEVLELIGLYCVEVCFNSLC